MQIKITDVTCFEGNTNTFLGKQKNPVVLSDKSKNKIIAYLNSQDLTKQKKFDLELRIAAEYNLIVSYDNNTVVKLLLIHDDVVSDDRKIHFVNLNGLNIIKIIEDKSK